MSAVSLFLEMATLKNKIDRDMQMAIWPKFFPLFASPANVTNLTMQDFLDFFSTIAQLSIINHGENAAALTSQFAAGGAAAAAVPAVASTSVAPARGILNLFSAPRPTAVVATGTFDSASQTHYRRNCKKILQYYSNSSFNYDFKVGELVTCMVYLFKSNEYKPLYHFLETAFLDENECMPNLEEDQMYNMTMLLKNLINLPTSTLDFSNVQILRQNLGKAMNTPLMRFPRIVVMQNSNLIKDKRCTLEELILDRVSHIEKMQPLQYIHEHGGIKNPSCKDEDLINALLKLTDKFSIHRMFYNAVNSIFYTTMENYAMANCKFEIADYNRIYKCMDSIRDQGVKNGLNTTDSLNVYLGSNGAKVPPPYKRKRI